MFVAGDPALGTLFLTCLGGCLAAGGAGAINHYIDRDIDAPWRAPPTRPMPAGRISPRRRSPSASRSASPRRPARAGRQHADRRAVASGLLGYVFVYTLWLKRRTPQNIVIGGAAGAVPPLVGWAAVTGGLDRPGALPVRDRLLLDAAALLGALAADQGRLRRSRHADAAGGPRRGARRGARSCSTRCCSSRSRQLPFCTGLFGVDLPGRRDDCSAPASSARAVVLHAHPTAAAALRTLPLLARLPGAALRRDGRSTGAALVEIRPWTARPQEPT